MKKEEHGLVYIYSDKWIGGRSLQLFPDHTFKFNDYNYANCSDCEQLCWGEDINIQGAWTYDKKMKILTLTSENWNGSSEKKSIQPQLLDSLFNQRVVQTHDFQFDNDQVNCFEAHWSYDSFTGMGVNVLKSTLKHNSKPHVPPVKQKKEQKPHLEPRLYKQQKKHENNNHKNKGCQNRRKHEDQNPNHHHKNK